MKTKLVRPVLVESEERTDIWWSGHKMYYNRTPKEPRTPCYQLILISLEPDDKIEVGDTIYSEILNQFEVLKEMPIGDLKFWFDGIFKVIATQSQLSPEYIQQVIEEYNKGDMKDLRIEIEYFENDISDCISMDGEPNGIPFNGYKPKLTNDYVTIVNKEVPIYTEEEVYSIMQQYLDNYVWSSGKYITPMEWFNQHKK